ncbi:hypothetical protein GCM10027168_11360 [Streptomyces capparidis]
MVVTGGQRGDAPCFTEVMERIPHMIPEKRDQAGHRIRRGSAGGRPPGSDPAGYKRPKAPVKTRQAVSPGYRVPAVRLVLDHQHRRPGKHCRKKRVDAIARSL